MTDSSGSATRGSAARRRADDDRFCDHCGYDLGLHGTDEPDGYDCYIARQKADLLMMFGRAFR